MINKKYPFNNDGDFDEVGAPFEYGNGKYPYNSNSRILPSQFNFPNTYMNYAVIRDINNNDDSIKD